MVGVGRGRSICPWSVADVFAGSELFSRTDLVLEKTVLPPSPATGVTGENGFTEMERERRIELPTFSLGS